MKAVPALKLPAIPWVVACDHSLGRNMLWFVPQRNFSDFSVVAFVLSRCKKATLFLWTNVSKPMVPVTWGWDAVAPNLGVSVKVRGSFCASLTQFALLISPEL